MVVDPTKMGYEKVTEAVWRNKESGLYYGFIDGSPWLVHDLAFGEASEIGIKKGDYEMYRGENEKLIARRKKEFQEKQAQKKLGDEARGEEVAPAQPVHAEVVEDRQGAHLVPTMPVRGIIRPVVSVDQAVEAWNQFQELKRRLLTDDDFVNIGGRKAPRKTAFRKVKVPFGINLRLISEVRRDLDDGNYEYTAKVCAEAPNGTFAEAESSCSSIEPFGIRQAESTRKLVKDPNRKVHPEMFVFAVRGMAQTRAYNRAISDLVGGLDTSAEELGED